jgi:hypothetical protein
MTDPVQALNFPDGASLQIGYDEVAENPREDCNLGRMVCFHHRYNLGDKHDYHSGDFSGFDALRKQIEKDNNVALILPVYMYDHSGITINTTGFHCSWDSGQIGFIFATKEDVYNAFSYKRITKRILKKVQDQLLVEIEVYDQYLRGDVYYYVLTTPDGETESCGGFHGRDIGKNGIIDALPEKYQEMAIDLCLV